MYNKSSNYDGVEGIKIEDNKHVELYILGINEKSEMIASDACRVCHFINFFNPELNPSFLKTVVVFVYLDKIRNIDFENKWEKAYNFDFSDLQILFISYEEYLDRLPNITEDPNIVLKIIDTRISSVQDDLLTEKERSIASLLSEIDSYKRPIEYYYSLSKHWCSRFRSAQPKDKVLDWNEFMNWVSNNKVNWTALEHNRWMVEAIQKGYKPLTQSQHDSIESTLKSNYLTKWEKKKEFIVLKERFKSINNHVDLCSFATLQELDPDSIVLDQVHNDKYLIRKIYDLFIKD